MDTSRIQMELQNSTNPSHWDNIDTMNNLMESRLSNLLITIEFFTGLLITDDGTYVRMCVKMEFICIKLIIYSYNF